MSNPSNFSRAQVHSIRVLALVEAVQKDSKDHFVQIEISLKTFLISNQRGRPESPTAANRRLHQLVPSQ